MFKTYFFYLFIYFSEVDIWISRIYYVTMPNDLLLVSKDNTNIDEKVSVVIEEAELISALRITKEEERLALQSNYQSVLTNSESTNEEKNEALEKIKSLNENASLESNLEIKIKKDYDLECCIEVDSSVITSTCSSSSHNNTLANNIMRSIQEEFDTNKYITIKFET